jgi:transglutaminase-like putative cysteine protease
VSRRRWAVVILTAWAASFAWLVKREFFRTTGERLAEAALAVPPGTVFFRLDLAGQQVGFASTTVDTVATALRVTDVLLLEFPVLGRMHRTRVRSRAVVSRALRLQTLDVLFEGDEGRLTAHGEVQGDSVLRMMLVYAGDSQATRLRLLQPMVVTTLLPLRLAFGSALKPGRTFATRVFDPLELAERDVSGTIVAESTLVVPDSAGFDSTTMAWTAARFDTVRAFRIEERSEGLTTNAWIDAQGRIVRATGPVGFTTQRTAYEIAYQNFRHRDVSRLERGSAQPGPGAIIASTALAAGASLPPPTRSRAEYRAVLTGADLSAVDLVGGRQERAGDTLIVRRETAAALAAAYRLPARDSSLAPWLAAEPLIQSADPGIRTEAHQILGGEPDPTRAAERLTHWVAAHVRKQATVGLPNAVRVLTQRRGDCNERTVLYVALARAIGLPARPVAGLLEVGGRFYYHAWPEVYLGRWVAVDPMLDQFPADAAHLRFIVGGLARQEQLSRFIGGLKVEGL